MRYVSTNEVDLVRTSRDLIQLYQVRYHHDGKYNVMSLDGSIQIRGTSRGLGLTLLSQLLKLN